jgi:hypothetical protein
MSISNAHVSVNSLSPEDREKLKVAIGKVDDSLTRVTAERELIKGTIDDLADQIGLDKKLIRKMAKTYHKASFSMDKEEFETFEEMYSTIFKVE